MEFANDLRRLRASAGAPPYRVMAKDALFSPSVLSSAASGHRFPTLPVTLAFVQACGGDRAEWERRWRRLRTQLTPDAPAPPDAVVDTGESPAPSALDVRPSQLPIGPHDFVGRRAALSIARQAVSVVSDTRVPLVIGGPVGAGKTVFASRFAHEHADDFPDGELFADMGGSGSIGPDPYEVMTGFLVALGVAPDRIPADRGHRTGMYRSLLAQREVIVVLDDVGEESRIRPLLARSMRSQILVTSRARLLGLDGVRRIMVDAFTRDESMELLGVLVGEDRVRADREVCFRLAELCDDLPLAITIAGRKIASQPDRPISAIVGSLVGGVHGLSWLHAGDTSLAATLSTAYRSLSGLSLEVFHRLGRGGTEELTADNVARLMKITADVAELALERLVDNGLLRRVPANDRYVMPSLVEQFAQDMAEEFYRYVTSTMAHWTDAEGADDFETRRPAQRIDPVPLWVPDDWSRRTA